LQDSPRWRRGGEAAEFEECDGVPAVVALRSSSMVSRGVLQIVEMKGSEMGPKRAGAWSSPREMVAAAPLVESDEMVAAFGV
jgi:hypothetical protein